MIHNTPLRTAGKFFSNLLMILYSISCIYPIVWIISSSLKTNREFMSNVMGLPKNFLIGNYIEILSKSPIGMYMLNTIRNTVISLIFVVFFAFINGYFISRFRFPGRRMLYILYMLGMLIPIHALLIPIYILFFRTGLTNSWYTVALPNIAFSMPISLFLVESYMGTVPREFEEAAFIDGSGFSRTLFTIIFPLVTPILVTVGIITFFTFWNEFSFSLVLLKSRRLFSLPLGLTLFKGEFQTDYPKMMTTMIIALIPAITIYISFSKKIMQGMMAGAIKG